MLAAVYAADTSWRALGRRRRWRGSCCIPWSRAGRVRPDGACAACTGPRTDALSGGHPMASPNDNAARLVDAFRRWDECKGKDSTMWTDLFAPHARIRSLGAGAAGLEFT